MKAKYYLYVMILLCSCGGNNREIVYDMPKFSEEKELKAEIINDTYLFQYAQYAILYDSLLFFTDITQQSVLHMFNAKNGEFIKSFATIGNGPGEVTIPSSITIDRKKGEIKVNDFGKRVIMSYNINALINDKEPYYDSQKVSDSLSNYYYVKFVKDSLYLIIGHNASFFLASPSGIVNVFHNDKFDRTLFENAADWNTFMAHAVGAVSPNGDKYVEGSLIGGIMNIYNITDNQINKKTVRNFFKPIFDSNQRAIAETVYGFCCFSVSDNYIYALSHAKANPTVMPKTIWKFDWDGNPIAAYDCDYSIESFVVSEDDKECYASIYLEDGRQAIAKYIF